MINLIQQIRSEAQPRPFNIKMKSLIVLSVLITLINVALVLGGQSDLYKGHSCKGCLFTKDNVWARVDGDIATVGVSDYEQTTMGGIMFVDLPYIGTRVASGEGVVGLEAGFSENWVNSPFSGTVIEVHSELENEPELINDRPYDDGWMIKIRLEDPDEIEKLMSEKEYLLLKKDAIEWLFEGFQETDTQQWTFDKEAYTINPLENKVYGPNH